MGFCSSRVGTWVLAVVALAAPAGAQQKRRVAVQNFDYGAVQSTVAALLPATSQDVGKGISSLLTDQLVAGGAFSVVERSQLDKVLAEQNFSNSDRADNASAAKLGKVLGVDGIIVGSITQFARDDRRVGVGGEVQEKLGRFGLGGLGKKDAKAVVAITARLINTNTAEILMTATGRGEASRSSVGVQGAGGGATRAGGAVDVAATNFGDAIMNQAVRLAVEDVARQLNGAATKLPAQTVTISGRVADVTGSTLIVNVGMKAGVKSGDRLLVARGSKEVRDPDTGAVLRRIEERIGEMVVTEVDEKSAVGTFSGAGKPKVGDSVRSL